LAGEDGGLKELTGSTIRQTKLHAEVMRENWRSKICDSIEGSAINIACSITPKSGEQRLGLCEEWEETEILRRHGVPIKHLRSAAR
jgi:hypothetical protein